MDNCGELSIVKRYYSGINPSYLMSDKRDILFVNEVSDLENLTKFNIDEYSDIKGTKLFTSGGEGPCHLSRICDDLILCSNYTSGSLSLLRRQEKSFVLCDHVIHSGSGKDMSRQESPHVHYSIYNNRTQTVHCVDLGIDCIVNYRIEDDKLIETSRFILEPGDGPRMMVLDSEYRHGYIVNELTSSVVTVSIEDSGKLIFRNRYSTLPSDFKKENYASHIAFSPCFNFLIISNRGHDSLVTFSVMENNLTKPIWTGSEGPWPRHFEFCNDGKNIIVANQEGNNISSFSFNNGNIKYTGYSLPIYKPTVVLNHKYS